MMPSTGGGLKTLASKNNMAQKFGYLLIYTGSGCCFMIACVCWNI